VTHQNGIGPYSESLLVHFRRVECLKKEAVGFPSLNLDARQLGDLELLLNRAYYPLEGYMDRAAYVSVLESMRLPGGDVWPLPVCLDVDKDLADTVEPGGFLALRDPEGFMLAVLQVQEFYKPDLAAEARAVFGTDDPAHPGVRRFLAQTREFYVAGRLEGLCPPSHYDFPTLRQTPSQVHRHFSELGWRHVAGFQTRAPLHRGDKAMILAAARNAGTSIFLQAAVDPCQEDQAGHFTLTRCCRAFAGQFSRSMLHFGLLSMTSRMAGPREALLEAVVRKNFGCTHYMVADDHADPFADSGGEGRRWYERGAAQELVAGLSRETDVDMVPLERTRYVEDRAQYLPVSQVEPQMTVKEIGADELARRLDLGLDIPDWFTFPEVVEELRQARPPRHKQGFTLFCTGLSGAGKSTLAKVLYTRFMERRDRPVTLLDGDIVRRNLSSELNYSREHRNLNVTRIGFVASEITKNGGIAICAPIAPYEESRRVNRELISQAGGYVEIYLSTPLEVCETRDRKGIYAKAKAGIMQGVTGIDDPYIPPSAPEITLDTSEMTPTEAAQEVLLFLEDQGYIR
jgi:sulfate adenylyltransferase